MAPASDPWQEMYDATSLKVCKALKNKLVDFGIFEQWCTFFGEEPDFLSDTMPKPLQVVRNMNKHGVTLDNFSGQDPTMLGLVFMELCKFCVLPL